MLSYLDFTNHSDRKKHYIHLVGKKPVAEIKDKLSKRALLFWDSNRREQAVQRIRMSNACSWNYKCSDILSWVHKNTELQNERLLTTHFSHRLKKVAQTQVKNGNQNLRCSFLHFYTKSPGQQRQTASTEMPTAGCKIYAKNLFQFLCKAAVYRQGTTRTAMLLPPGLFGDPTWKKRWQHWAKPPEGCFDLCSDPASPFARRQLPSVSAPEKHLTSQWHTSTPQPHPLPFFHFKQKMRCNKNAHLPLTSLCLCSTSGGNWT